MILFNEGEPNKLLSINSLYAFVSVDNEGNEGLCAYFEPKAGMWMAMVAADEARVASLIPYAEEMSKNSEKKIKLIRLTNRVEIRTF